MRRRWSSGPEALLAPGAGGEALRLPPREKYPPLDEHLVQPEVTRDEVVRGRRMIAQPANPAHADPHCNLDFLIAAHTRPEYVGSTDLLTRHAEQSNFATDTCVRRKGIDPTTDQRYLEELAFEVVHEQTLKDMTERAEEVSARGVRRFIGIFVKKGIVREWSPTRHTWIALDLDGTLSDPCLLRPVAVRALLSAAVADNEVMQAMLIKRPPALVEHDAEIRRETKSEVLRAALLKLVARRKILLSEDERAHIDACDDPTLLERWHDNAIDAASAVELFK